MCMCICVCAYVCVLLVGWARNDSWVSGRTQDCVCHTSLIPCTGVHFGMGPRLMSHLPAVGFALVNKTSHGLVQEQETHGHPRQQNHMNW